MSTSTDKNPTFSYAESGTYDVSLKVTLPSGKNTTVHQTIDVFLLSDVSYSYVTDCDTVTFTDTSIAPNIISWHWLFDDGAESFDQNPVHDFPMAFNYGVSLTIRTANGGIGFTSQNIVISSGTVTADFTSIKTDMSLAFTDTSSVDCGAVAWIWDFGDGSGTSSLQNPTYVYSVAGTYTVNLTVYDAIGGFDTVTHDVSPTLAAVDWCFETDFVTTNGSWSAISGSYLAGWNAVSNDMYISYNMGSSQQIISADITFFANWTGSLTYDSILEIWNSGVFVAGYIKDTHAPAITGTTETLPVTPPLGTGDEIRIRLKRHSGSGTFTTLKLTHLVLNGHGANPFGLDNC